MKSAKYINESTIYEIIEENIKTQLIIIECYFIILSVMRTVCCQV